MVYTDTQVDTLVALNVTASTFSFLGACFIIANFFAFEDFRKSLAFKLILFVAVGDVINSLGNFLGSPKDGSFLCYLQAFLTQFGDIVSFAWVTAIAAVIYNVINREDPPTQDQIQKWPKRIHLIIWPITLTLSILPFFSGSYGNDNGLCWIKVDPTAKEDPWGEVWRWLCFYLPLLGGIAYVGTCYYKIWGQLTAPNVSRKNSDVSAQNAKPAENTNAAGNGNGNELEVDIDPKPKESTSDVYHEQQHSSNLDVFASTTDIHDHQHSSGNVTGGGKSSGMLQRIKFYPFVLFGCYFFAIIRRITELANPGGDAPFGITALQVFTSACLGTCNAILYGFTDVVYKKDSEWIKSKCCGKDVKVSFDGGSQPDHASTQPENRGDDGQDEDIR